MSTRSIYNQLATLLTRRRKSRRLSRQKVAKQLHVPLNTVTSLENPSLSTIPHSHLPGLYRKYAQILDYDTKKVAELLAKIADTPPPNKKRRQSKNTTLIISQTLKRSLTGVVVLAFAFYALWQLDVLLSPPKLVIHNLAEYSLVNQERIVLEGEAEADSIVFVNNEPISIEGNGSFRHELYLQRGYNSIEVSASNNFSRQTRLQRVIIFESP